MHLYLVQHGLSLPKEIDPQRGLTPEGMEETKRMAQLLAHHGESQIHVIWHSTKSRSRQTAHIIADTLDIPNRVLEHTHLSPTEDIMPVYKEIMAAQKDKMIVGHLPFLDNLLLELLKLPEGKSPVEFRNSAVLILQKEKNKWNILSYISPDFV